MIALRLHEAFAGTELSRRRPDGMPYNKDKFHSRCQYGMRKAMHEGHVERFTEHDIRAQHAIDADEQGFKSACSTARGTNSRIHDLRHTCASWMISEGVPLMYVKEVLGHSTVKMTKKYAHLAPHRARDAVNQLGKCTRGGSPPEVAQDLQTQSGHSERPVHFIEGLPGRKRRA